MDGAGRSATFQNDGTGGNGIAFLVKKCRLQSHTGKEPFGQCDARNRCFGFGTATNDAGNLFDTK